MNPFNWLASVFSDLKYLCLDIAHAIWGAPFVPDILGDWFWDAFWWFQDAQMECYALANWYDQVTDDIADFLTWEYWLSLWQDWYSRLAEVWEWFLDWLSNVWAAVDQWWEEVRTTVLQWINAATEGFAELKVAWDNFWNITWQEWTGNLIELRLLWDTFWTYTFPTLLDDIKLEAWWTGKLADIDALIRGKLEDWFPFYDDLTDIWEDIKTFFNDPLEWLWTRFTDWFLGKE